MIVEMLRLQERINNPEKQTREFILSLPLHQDHMTIWISEFEIIRKEFNELSFAEITTKILELENRLEALAHYSEFTKVLMYHYLSTEIWVYRDFRSLKYVVDELPAWEDLPKNETLMLALFN